jgi:hypothetical protein
MTSNRAPKIVRLRALHQTATTTQSYAEWLESVRAILKHLPALLDEVEESAR